MRFCPTFPATRFAVVLDGMLLPGLSHASATEASLGVSRLSLFALNPYLLKASGRGHRIVGSGRETTPRLRPLD